MLLLFINPSLAILNTSFQLSFAVLTMVLFDLLIDPSSIDMVSAVISFSFTLNVDGTP